MKNIVLGIIVITLISEIFVIPKNREQKNNVQYAGIGNVFSSAPSEITSLNEEYFTSMHNNEVKVYVLKDGNSEIGHSIWMYRKNKKVKAKYFAFKDLHLDQKVVDRFNSWKSGKKIIFYSAAGYTTKDYKNPVGITLDNGRTVNNNVDSEMDALVIVEAVGGVRVSDLDEYSCITLASANISVNPRMPKEKQTFLNWAAQVNATVFQTNLLYYSGSPKPINRPEKAERRMFALAKNNNGEVIHILFNVEPSYSFKDLSDLIYNYLKSKNLDVVAILNYDTGMRNIFQLYKENGSKYSNIKGPSDINEATNLIVYYYE